MMDCCDQHGDCRQGRDCPARRVKAYPTVPADPPPFEYVPTWRDRLPDIARAALIVVIVMISASLAAALVIGR